MMEKSDERNSRRGAGNVCWDTDGNKFIQHIEVGFASGGTGLSGIMEVRGLGRTRDDTVSDIEIIQYQFHWTFAEIGTSTICE